MRDYAKEYLPYILAGAEGQQSCILVCLVYSTKNRRSWQYNQTSHDVKYFSFSSLPLYPCSGLRSYFSRSGRHRRCRHRRHCRCCCCPAPPLPPPPPPPPCPPRAKSGMNAISCLLTFRKTAGHVYRKQEVVCASEYWPHTVISNALL